MTPIYVKFERDPGGKCIHLSVHSDKVLHIAEYITIMETWFSVLKKQHESDIKEYEDLKSSGKLVSMTEWKKQT
jgi:hypothetical protein